MPTRLMTAVLAFAFAGAAGAQPATGEITAALETSLETGADSLAGGDPAGAVNALVSEQGLIRGTAGQALNQALTGVVEQDPAQAQTGLEGLAEALQADGGPLDRLAEGPAIEETTLDGEPVVPQDTALPGL